MAAIPSADHAKEMKELDLLLDPLPMERALGVQWCVESDTFQFRIMFKDGPLTRRGVLSTVSSIYDPLGFLAPLVLKGKLILQQLCKEEADWDDPLSDELKREWEKWRNDIVNLQSLHIQRCVKPADFGVVKSIELHHFSDASTSGYGQCSYVRFTNEEQQVHCAFVMGKARVVPIKPITIPRLELTAAVVSVNVSTFLNQESDLSVTKEVFWTDSRIVLGYINNNSRRFHMFVANRVQQIRDRTNPDQWRYVKAEENLADAASRGLWAQQLEKSKWLNGPEFLWKKLNPIPESDMDENLKAVTDDPEVRIPKPATAHVACTEERQENFLDRLEYFSDWFHAKRAVAMCTKLIEHLKSRRLKSVNTDIPISVTTKDIEQAKLAIIKMVQAQEYSKEIEILKSLQPNGTFSDKDATRQKKAMRKSSALYRLGPFLDSEGLLRVGGRLKAANISTDVKYPVILPKKHHITQLVIRDCHEKTEHQGRGLTVNEIRSNGYWIIGCTSAVSRLIYKCVKCRKFRGCVQEQKMADLPSDRMAEGPPFTYCAVDFFGPFYIKEGRKELKRYGVLFTCMACRAIHIETANALSTDSFINALRRFLTIRGPIRQLRSDQGTHFIGAKTELKESISEIDHENVQRFLLTKDCDYIDFKMNVPSASHMGGSWERQIRTVRSILASLMDQVGTQLDDESLRTVMCEAAAIVNSRPLSVNNLNDPTSLEPLTPNHLLTMKSKVLLPPPGCFQRTDLYSRKRWRRVQYRVNEFWFRWRKEFLQTLQTRQKWTKQIRNICVGDMVIIRDENLPRNRWLLTRVCETYPSQDGLVRKVKLAISDGSIDDNGRRKHVLSFLERPIHKLVLLLENEDLK